MNGRPGADEAAAYYLTYIDAVGGDDVLAVMERQLEEVPGFLVGISEAKSLSRYAPEKWSIRQVLNHLTDTERAFAFRGLWFARGFAEPLPGFDQNIAAGGIDADAIPWAAHIEEFRGVRKGTIGLFRNMPEDAWGRRGVASGNTFSVRAVAFIIAGHVEHHLRILRERYL